MIDILDRPALFAILSKLRPDATPAFGAMTAQHMVEHLAFTIRFANGKAPQRRYYSPEKEQKIKAFVLGTGEDMPIGFKSPVLPPEKLPELRFPHFDEAVENLSTELTDFDSYFLHRPLDTPVNPTMGELNYKEWVQFHNRHFSHHFRQFRLL